MGLFRKRQHTEEPTDRPSWMHTGRPMTVVVGHETLEVVGESHYQDKLWRIVRARTAGHVNHPVNTANPDHL
ncbi:MAG: hypothetical protein NVSMB4_20660 [Acidimicrobiales bacterium]